MSASEGTESNPTRLKVRRVAAELSAIALNNFLSNLLYGTRLSSETKTDTAALTATKITHLDNYVFTVFVSKNDQSLSKRC